MSTLLPRIAGTTHAPLSRDPQDYLVLGMRSTRVFSLAMEPPGCNIGVNCVPTVPGGRKCGFFHAKGGQFPSPSQVVANQVCGTASFHQVFANLPTCADPTCAAIADPGSSPDCTEPFAGPIVGDLDGDNAPSCDGDCSTDPDDIARLCGTTLPFPACDPSSPVLVEEDSDCSLGDTMPGNMRCDLGPGTYGAVRVRKGARIVFGAGTTVVCSLNVRTAARVTTDGQATVLLPGKGAARFGNSVDAAGDCGRLRIVSEAGFFRLGRFGDFTIDACTIRGTMKLGHGNNLRGHIVGDVVASDISNDGRCCPRIVVSTTTTTPTTSTTATTTTSTSVTSTTEPPPTTTTTSSTTTTTDPGATTTTTFSTITTTTVSTTTTTTTEPPTTTSITVITTTTSQPPTTTTTTTTQPTTTTTTQPPMTTTTAITSTTTTTTPGGGQFTRTPGFWKNHPAIVQQTLSAGALDVCGHAITDVDVNHGHSALEGMCVTVGGDQRVQLVRQLIAAALNMAAGGATFGDFTACNALCQDPGASVMDLASCIDSTDAYNNSGDAEAAPFDPPGRADPRPCQRAHSTACTVLSPAACAAP